MSSVAEADAARARAGTSVSEAESDAGSEASSSGSEAGSSSSSSSGESEDEEPRLKYKRLCGSVADILAARAATCMAVSTKFLVLGTDYGTLHILDSINGTEAKMFQQHTERITGITIDKRGDYVATCSDDGKVVIRNLYEDDNTVTHTFDRPIRTVAIDPEYSKRRKNMFVTGGSKGLLVMHEDKGWGLGLLQGTKQRTLHAGEGTIEAIKWRGIFIAWANDVGIKVFDTTSNQRISYVDRPKGSPRPDEYRCRLEWKDDNTLLMGWADHIAVGEIRQHPPSVTAAVGHPAVPQRYMQLLVRIKTDFWIAGIAPFGDEMALLAHLDNEVENEKGARVVEGDEPEFKLMTMQGVETSTDPMPVKNYQRCRANDYWLESLPEDRIYYIVSPKDILVATPFELDDRIKWYQEKGRYAEALQLAKDNQHRLTSISMLDVYKVYLKHLLDSNRAADAAALAPAIFGTDVKLWEQWILSFLQYNALSALAPYIPIDKPRLSRNIYEQVLFHFLQDGDHATFYKTLESWNNDMISVEKITPAVEKQAIIHRDSVELSKGLAMLYTRANKHQDALRIYLDLGRLEAFDLIEKQNLFQTVKDRVVQLMDLNAPRAMSMLRDNRDKLPVSVIVPQLEKYPKYQLEYLEAVALVEPSVGRDYGRRLVELTATHAREKLLRLLQSNTIPLRDATEICERRQLWREYAYCLQHGGKVKEAIKLMISKIGLVEEAIELVTQENDDSLWDELIQQCFDSENNEYIKTLLANAGTHIDPARIIQHPKLRGRKIEGLRDSLVKILSDFNLQKELLKGCTDILTTDVVSLMQKLNRMQKQGVFVNPVETYCTQCRANLLGIVGKPNERFILFHCKHVFCAACLEERSAGRDRSRTVRGAANADDHDNSGPVSTLRFCPVCRSSEMEARRGAADRRRPDGLKKR